MYECPSGGDHDIVIAVIALLITIIILAVVWWSGRPCESDTFDDARPRERLEASPDRGGVGGVDKSGVDKSGAVGDASRLYSTADVDPLITYSHAGNVRNIYAQRTAHSDAWGLTEYGSGSGSGGPSGPFGLAEYGGRQIGFDDGIPEPWALPSTPIRWYRPARRDYYGPEGATVYSEGLYSLTEPDHDPLVN